MSKSPNSIDPRSQGEERESSRGERRQAAHALVIGLVVRVLPVPVVEPLCHCCAIKLFFFSLFFSLYFSGEGEKNKMV
jgi:hypothetical protein